ncbi:unnamed protein product [Medioppia subpectinata]|uniref:NADH dehydrogenase [ubiquinone] 1 alpha subcomplex subunit 7 n=1 Tax=Medioppia subpectinata TaxID=1979941 RepID=A0A7R9KI85_9ACAR|nr:unnamed protein product [Medioppia subpectinata]CAG2103719.1 unnamed protein product [Medioppia subpectinata]
MSSGGHRDVGPLLQMLRSFLRGRSWNEQLRQPQHLSHRPYPSAQLPGGPSHETSANYYYTRDARRLVTPPVQVMDNTAKQLTQSGVKEAPLVSKTAPKPGFTYNWD